MTWRGNTVIFTSVTGGYDQPQSQPEIDGVEYIFFTDDPSLDVPPPWTKVILDADPSLDARRRAKFPKLFPQQYDVLTKYQYGIWIDGTMGIANPNFPEELLYYLDNGIVLTPHFDPRDCAYGEATITGHPKYKNEPLAEQVTFYRKEGFPEHYGLYECGVIGRDLHHPLVHDMCAMWLDQNLTWSYQDQVSLPYCLWKTGLKPGVLPQTFRKYGWVWMNLHMKDELYQ